MESRKRRHEIDAELRLSGEGSNDGHEGPLSKRLKLPAAPSATSSTVLRDDGDRLSLLSDEILVRILHHLPLETTLLVQRVSRRFDVLAKDSQVWKRLYYEKFVLPRALRLRRTDAAAAADDDEDAEDGERGRWHFSSRNSRWLDEEWLLEWRAGGLAEKKRGRRTEWKARYRLRHNWSRGKAEVRKLGMEASTGRDGEAEAIEPGGPGRKLMARLVNGIVVTASEREGLRAWDARSRDAGSETPPVAACALDGAPSSIAIESGTASTAPDIVVGFASGGFGIWRLLLGGSSHGVFENRFVRAGPSRADGSRALAAIAYSHPYLLAISAAQVLSLYGFPPPSSPPPGPMGDTQALGAPGTPDITNIPSHLCDPTLLASLKSHTTWPPLTLSIRPTPASIIASIAYSLPTYTSGWSVGLQELHIDPVCGSIIQSRLASAIDTGFHSLLSSPSSGASTPLDTPGAAPQPSSSSSSSSSRTDGRGHGQGANNSIPTSLSYAHPYLLAGHGDNTLTLYLVSSTPAALRIGRGAKLWGHTSEVSGAIIGGRGRAVSVGGGGAEVRLWELEGGSRRGERSVRVEGGSALKLDGAAGGDSGAAGTAAVQCERKGWVGFDDEVVVVMKESTAGGEGPSLLVYDFT